MTPGGVRRDDEAPPEGVEILPRPGFVVKTLDAQKKKVCVWQG